VSVKRGAPAGFEGAARPDSDMCCDLQSRCSTGDLAL
jgi:hypothetical protein